MFIFEQLKKKVFELRKYLLEQYKFEMFGYNKFLILKLIDTRGTGHTVPDRKRMGLRGSTLNNYFFPYHLHAAISTKNFTR